MNLERITVAIQEPEYEHPPGNAPVLVSKVRARRDRKGQAVPTLQPQPRNGVDLTLGDSLLHGLLKRMQDPAVKGEWDLALAVPTFTHATSEEDLGRTVN